MSEFELANPPTDGITCVKFSPTDESLLLASSWDSTVRLYDTASNKLLTNFQHSAGLLDCTFGEGSQAYSGGIDNSVHQYDLTTQRESLVGTHTAPVRAVVYASSLGTVISGSWDKHVKMWDPRTKQATATVEQPHKVFTMAQFDDTLIVGTAGRHVWIWDLRKMDSPTQRRESNLKYQTRCIRASPNKKLFVQTSIEGRSAVEMIDPRPEFQKLNYAFKCHRVDNYIYPVNTVAFHPLGTFATGGCDKVVFTWDGQNKKRLASSRKYPTSISSLSFSKSGDKLAVASSYTFEEGEKDHPADAIFIRTMASNEYTPKA